VTDATALALGLALARHRALLVAAEGLGRSARAVWYRAEMDPVRHERLRAGETFRAAVARLDAARMTDAQIARRLDQPISAVRRARRALLWTRPL
jgi:hypothetical protein